MQHPTTPSFGFWSGKRLPMMLQTEAAECGLACVAMIATYWGHRIDLPSMRRRFAISLKGSTLKGLIAIGQALQLQSRPLKLDLEHLPELKLPCVLHWDMNHFVVLKATHRSCITIHDPASGERSLPMSEVSKHFTGVALELTPGTCFAKTEELQKFTLLSLMGRVIGLKRGLAQLLSLGLVLQVFSLIVPFYLQWVIDEAVGAGDHDLLTVLGLGFLLLVLMQTAIGAVRSWVTTVLATNLNFQWLGNAFAHLMKLPLPYFEKRHLGDIVSRFGSIQTIQRSLTTQFVEGLIDGTLVIGTFVVMLLYSIQLTTVAFVAVSLYILLRWSIFRSLRQATSEQIVHAARQQSHFLESVRGVQSIRLFNRAEEATDRLDERARRTMQCRFENRETVDLVSDGQRVPLQQRADRRDLARGAGGARRAFFDRHAVRVHQLQGSVHAACLRSRRQAVRVAHAPAARRTRGPMS